MNVLWLVLVLWGKAPVRAEVEGRIRSVPVRYLDFAGQVREGAVEVDSSLAREVEEIFAEILAARFPLRSVRSIAEFGGDDEASMRADNTSGWNWRKTRGTRLLSWHALGRAIDLNPLENPMVKGCTVRPEGARRDTAKPGTLLVDGAVVRAFRKRGWHWGGRWKGAKDWQHFEKPQAGVDRSLSPLQAERGPKRP